MNELSTSFTNSTHKIYKKFQTNRLFVLKNLYFYIFFIYFLLPFNLIKLQILDFELSVFFRIFFIIVGFILIIKTKNVKNNLFSKILKPWIIYLSFKILLIIFSDNIFLHLRMFTLDIASLLVFWVGFKIFGDYLSYDIKKVNNFLMVAVAIIVITALYGLVVRNDLYYLNVKRAGGLFLGHPNSMAMFLSLAFINFIFFRIFYKKGKIKSLLNFFLPIIILITIIYSQARISWFTVLISIIILIIFLNKRKSIKLITLSVVIFFLIYISIPVIKSQSNQIFNYLNFTDFSSYYNKNISNLKISHSPNNLIGRFSIWGSILRNTDNYLTGDGAGTVTRLRFYEVMPHSDYVTILVEYGSICFFLYLIFKFSTFYYPLKYFLNDKSKKYNRLWLLLTCIIAIQGILFSITENAFTAYEKFHLTFWLIYGMVLKRASNLDTVNNNVKKNTNEKGNN